MHCRAGKGRRCGGITRLRPGFYIRFPFVSPSRVSRYTVRTAIGQREKCDRWTRRPIPKCLIRPIGPIGPVVPAKRHRSRYNSRPRRKRCLMGYQSANFHRPPWSCSIPSQEKVRPSPTRTCDEHEAPGPKPHFRSCRPKRFSGPGSAIGYGPSGAATWRCPPLRI